MGSLLLSRCPCYSQSGWTISTDKYDTAHYEGLTLANGMTGLVPSIHPFRFEKVVLSGVYDRYGSWGDGISNIVQGIHFMDMDIQADGISMGSAKPEQLTAWQQTIDMQKALFTTSFIYDNSIAVHYTACALRQLPYDALVTVRIEALKDVRLTVSHVFSGSPSATITATRYEQVENIPLASAQAVSPTGKVTIAAAACFLFPDTTHPSVKAMPQGMGFQQVLKKGGTLAFALAGATCSSVHFPDPKNASKRLALAACLQGERTLIEKHIAAWKRLWQSDIIIDGDPQAQQDVRFALYNLYSFAREGTANGLSPMGLSGTGYNGHVFWDCETWMYPVLLVLHPGIARSLLDYRYDRLQAAKQNAFSNGYEGAMYPWESAADGTEETPVWALTGPLEQHITADINIAFWHYYLVTRDKSWLKEKGYPVIQATAGFWAGRAEKNKQGEYGINHVVCADEYAEDADNDAFTNAAAVTALRNAQEAALALGEAPDPQWEAVAAHIPIRYFGDSVVKEYDTYNGQTIKQADADLLSYPLHCLSPAVSRKTLDYYAGRIDTANGPAMTYSIFSIICSQLGEPKEAYRYFQQAYRPNLRPPFGVFAETATSDNPYFATGAGGMLQAVLYGFAGLQVTDKGIVQAKAVLPPGWKRLTITGVGPERRTIVCRQIQQNNNLHPYHTTAVH